jgi:hypothetical protein
MSNWSRAWSNADSDKCGIAAQVGGSHNHTGSGGFGSRRDLCVISADVDRVDEPRGAARVDGALDQASAADSPQILAGYAFGAAAGRNDRNHLRMIHAQ